MDKFEIRVVSTRKVITEIVPDIEMVGNRILDFSVGGVKPKINVMGPELRTRDVVITSVAAGYNRNTIYERVGHVIGNLLY